MSDARVTVLVDARAGSEGLDQTLASIREREPIELLVALDPVAAGGEATEAAGNAGGAELVRLGAGAAPAELVGAGVAAGAGRYLLVLGGGDLAVAGMLRTMADRLDRLADLDLCFGDFLVDGGDRFALREISAPPIGFELPAMFRCESLLDAGWNPKPERASYLGERVISFIRPGAVDAEAAAPPADAAKARVLIEAARDPVRSARSGEGARVAVLIPCFNDGRFVVAAAQSVREREPVEIWVIDDASTEPETAEALARLEDSGFCVMHQQHNSGPAPARNRAVGATSAPYVFPLDADDLAVAGSLTKLADALDADPELAVAYADVEELTATETVVRRAPESLDPYLVALVNEMPLGSLYRKAVIEPLGCWQDPYEHLLGYEDWDLWMSLAEAGAKATRVDDGLVAYRYRLHASRMTAATKRLHPTLYAALRRRHPGLFEHLAEHRRESSLGPVKKALYPYVYGGRQRHDFERHVKRGLDRLGIWTRRR